MRESPSGTELIRKIEQAFAHRKTPPEVVEMEGRLQIDSDVEDGLWFQGRDWHEITKLDWENHHWGFSYLSPAAFAYFLPSILSLTTQNPQDAPDLAVCSFVWELDSSPGVENLNPHSYRYYELTDDEFEAVKAWLLWACENKANVFHGMAVGGPGDGFGRAFDAIDLLHKEAMKHRERDRAD